MFERINLMPQANPLAESELSEGGPEGNCPSTDLSEAWLADLAGSKILLTTFMRLHLGSLKRRSLC